VKLIAKYVTELELSGKVYKVTRLKMGDWSDFEEWVKQQRKNEILEVAKTLYGDNIPVEVFTKMVEPPSDDELEQWKASLAGIRYLLWRALLKYNPNITSDEAGQLARLDDIPKISEAIMPEEILQAELKIKGPKKNLTPKRKRRH